MWILLALIIGIGIVAAATELLSKEDSGDDCGDEGGTDNCQTCGEVSCQLRMLKEKSKEARRRAEEKSKDTPEGGGQERE